MRHCFTFRTRTHAVNLPTTRNFVGTPGSVSARLFVFLVSVTAALGGLLFGYDTGVISGALLFLKAEFSLSSNGQAILTSMALVGAAAGATFGGSLADRFGRRPVMLAL